MNPEEQKNEWAYSRETRVDGSAVSEGKKGDKGMALIDPEPVARYVRSLECPDGGFCFYRLDEPNLFDTFFAVHTLAILGNGPAVLPKTIAFTREFFARPLARGFLWGAVYAAGILDLYEEPVPRREELQDLITHYLEQKLALGSHREKADGVELMNYAVETMALPGNPVNQDLREKARDYLLRFRNEGGGFGTVPNLKMTFLVSNMLCRLDYPFDERSAPIKFIRRCEDEHYGFTGVPGSTPAFLEDIFFGLSLCSLFNIRPRFPAAILRFIRDCQSVLDGFRRSHLLGITTLEYTYMAVKALALLEGNHAISMNL